MAASTSSAPVAPLLRNETVPNSSIRIDARSSADSTSTGVTTPSAQAPDHFDAVDSGQVDVEHDHVGIMGVDRVDRVLAAVLDRRHDFEVGL